MELVPLKVKILRRAKFDVNGTESMGMDYPTFNSLPMETRENLDWCNYVDKYGGWHYDKKSKLGQSDDVVTDKEVQYGCILVKKNFAQEAVKEWPNRVKILSEEEFEDFYDNRAHAGEPDEVINNSIVNAVLAKDKAGVKLTKKDKDAMDPESDVPGITKNKRKKWATNKKDIKIVGVDEA
jgi:hypothetical protein